MAKYAQFDPNTPSPHPVNGWYDADAIDYPNLPPSTSLYQMSEAQWATHMDDTSQMYAYDGTTLIEYTPPPPPPTADSIYSEKIAEGIALTSSSTPALNGTYPIDPASLATIGAAARDASSGMGLPNGAPTVPVTDIGGAIHDFDEQDIIASYKASRDLVYNLGQQRDIMAGGGDPIWPPQSAAIP